MKATDVAITNLLHRISSYQQQLGLNDPTFARSIHISRQLLQMTVNRTRDPGLTILAALVKYAPALIPDVVEFLKEA